MATLARGYSFGATEQVTNTKLHNLVDLGSISGITNADIDSGAAISDTKLDLATIAQVMQFNGAVTAAASITMSSAIFKPAKGADVASVAGTMTLGDDGNYFDITGTNAITSITAKTAGTIVVLQFDSTATLTDGSNLKLAGNFTGAAEAQIMLVSDGTNWFEVCRNSTTYTPTAANALSGSVVQTVAVASTTPVNVTAVYQDDDSPPLYAEGNVITSASITPNNSANTITIMTDLWGSFSGGNDAIFYITDGSASATAIAVRLHDSPDAGDLGTVVSIIHAITAGSTSARTYYLLGGVDTGTFYVGRTSTGTDKFGNANFVGMVLQEIKA